MIQAGGPSGNVHIRDARVEQPDDPFRERTEWIQMIIHDLKGPLTSIIANLDLLSRSSLRGEDRNILELAQEGCRDLFGMIVSILEIGKMEAGKMELNLSIINPGELLLAVQKRFQPQCMQKDLTLQVSAASRTTSLAVDKGLLERVLCNLVLNALTYTGPGGKVILSAEDVERKDRILLSVRDTGRGIPAEDRERIFDLYAQVPPARKADAPSLRDSGGKEESRGRGEKKGTGVGLAFCRLAAELHGGRIFVESEEGKGSAFFVELPANLIPSGSGFLED